MVGYHNYKLNSENTIKSNKLYYLNDLKNKFINLFFKIFLFETDFKTII